MVKKKNGFTLVELLAVIVILAIILVIAVPQIMKTIDESKNGAFISSAKLIAASAEREYLARKTLDDTSFQGLDSIPCSEVAETSSDYESCTVKFDSAGKASVSLVGAGKFAGKNICNGTRTGATVTEEECSTAVVKNCTYEGEMIAGATYAEGQYTYKYLKKYDRFGELVGDDILVPGWSSMDEGWGVIGNAAPTDAFCTTINGEPVVATSAMYLDTNFDSLDVSKFNTSNINDMSYMFYNSSATSIDLSSFDTKNVTNMSGMFGKSSFTTLDLKNFDTSKVTSMFEMFYDSSATSIDLSSFVTTNVTRMSSMFYKSKATTLDLRHFDTQNVTDMSSMFEESAATTIDLSNWNTGKVTNMSEMFYESKVTNLDLRSFDTSKLTTMYSMFSACEIETLLLPENFGSNVTIPSSYNVFYNASIETIYVKNEADKTRVEEFINDDNSTISVVVGYPA